MPKIWRVVAECLVASLSLASLTVVCYRLHFNLAMASLLYVIVLVVRTGNLVSSIKPFPAKLSRKSFDGDSSCQIYQTMATLSRCNS